MELEYCEGCDWVYETSELDDDLYCDDCQGDK
jgi:hypothetical protein